ncbi:hypothetical protein [Mariniblastus fucicola]|uniref:Uncharacterized protein n=1 Tax=Mariniblastus fucicola TaxID=980251 RepID=A0A5B9PI61_9BACT|nr:hypothetical protein [Mariniblastus fucicola]QEG22323.1 hypothetical protein MFFC18_22030 [Mariniblastus fucicola]
MTDFVFATHSGLYFARVGSDSALQDCTLIAEGYHYGITTRFDVAKDETLIRAYRGGVDVHNQTERESIEYRIRDMLVEEVARHELDEISGHVHQFAIGPGDSMFIANTKRNSVDLWHPNEGTIKRLVFDGHRNDVNHVNSIFPCGDILAVMLHNLRKLESQIAICQFDGADITELGRFSLPDVQCHNVGVLGTQLFYNASGSCSTVSLNLESLEISHRLKMKEHTKGMCSDGDLVYAGMSNYANRSERAFSSAWVVIIDPQTMQVNDTVQFTESARKEKVGNINEIRIVGQEDVFDTGSKCSPDLLRSTVDVPQNQLAISLRRFWIGTSDPIKRTIKKMLQSGNAR